MSHPDDRDSRCSRREFVRRLGAGAVALGAGACLPGTEGDWPSCNTENDCTDPELDPPMPASSRVVEVSSPGVADPVALVIEAGLVPAMVVAGLKALTGLDDEAAAWAAVLPGRTTGEIVGLKVNTLNERVPSSKPLVSSLVASLTGTVPADELLVWDRHDDELITADLTEATLGCRALGTIVESGSNQGPGYEERAACLSGKSICLSTLLTRETQHLINVSVMKSHSASGFTGCLKNNYGCFSNPGDFHDSCEQHIARLNALPQITGPTRLHVMDALIGVAFGDTHKSEDCAPGRILLSFDPVAIDQRGQEIRDEMRVARGAPVGAPGKYLPIAEALGLGTRSYELVTVVAG